MRALEQDEAARSQWRQDAASWNTCDLVFVDECGCNTTLHRTHGRAPRGERLEAAVPRNWRHNTTVVGALCLDEAAPWQAMTLEGACDALAFEAFVEQVLLPTLRPGQIVIWDNLNVHKSARARQRIEQAGCRLEFLPTYSPDLNPIEMMWSKLKAHLRAVAARTQDALDDAITAGLFAVTRQDAQAWFDHAGYSSLAQPL